MDGSGFAFPLGGGKDMAHYHIMYQIILGKIIQRIIGTTISAGSSAEAKQKFLSEHNTIGSEKYKIISIIKFTR
ncbi:MAG: hypothetical protein LBP42_04435 [Treponema sp.]|nr:hypothetical protein [Treponema sp.]